MNLENIDTLANKELASLLNSEELEKIRFCYLNGADLADDIIAEAAKRLSAL